SLDSTLVDDLQLKVTPSERMLRGISSFRKISYITDKTLYLPGLVLPHLDFHINDYGLLTSVYGVRIDGIIGYSFFKQFVVKVNYERQLVEVWSPGVIKYPKSGHIIKPNLGFIPVFDAVVADGSNCTSRFYFDTGAGLCLLMSADFERDSSILIKGKRVINTQAEGLGGKKPMKLTTVKELKIGKYRFKNVPAHIFEDEYKVTSYPQLGGLIGNDLLRRFNLVINYPDGEIHLKPNSSFKERFDYSYSGLGIYLVDGEIVIEDVLEDSPGEKAGLKPGDIILAIDNAFNVGIQGYKDMLQQVGGRFRILVRREGVLEVFTLKVKSFL
ncbi:MAG TPA: aspartyl protease family protein, partial [Segetibacter sp.]